MKSSALKRCGIFVFGVAIALACGMGSVLQIPSLAWADEGNEYVGMELEDNGVEFNMVRCPVCAEKYPELAKLDRAWHFESVGPSAIPRALELKDPEGPLPNSNNYRITTAADGIVNSQDPREGTLTATVDVIPSDGCYSVFPYQPCQKWLTVQLERGAWGGSWSAVGEPCDVFLDAKDAGDPEFNLQLSTEGGKGTYRPLVNDWLTPRNEAARILERHHAQRIVSVASSNPAAVRVEKETLPVGENINSGEQTYTGFYLNFVEEGSSEVVVADLTGKKHVFKATVRDYLKDALRDYSVSKKELTVKVGETIDLQPFIKGESKLIYFMCKSSDVAIAKTRKSESVPVTTLEGLKPGTVRVSFGVLDEGAFYEKFHPSSSPTFDWFSDHVNEIPTADFGFMTIRVVGDASTAKPQPDPAPKPISLAGAKVSVPDRAWTGKALRPKVTVRLGGKALREGADYAVKVAGSPRKVGPYRVTVTGKGAYAGTAAATFRILPKGTSVKKLAKAKRGLTVTWKKQAGQVDGYKVQWSTDKKFKKGVKSRTVKLKSSAGKKCKLKVSGLEGGKRYYVRVCTYKSVKENGKTVKYCSAWSKAKSVKTKK